MKQIELFGLNANCHIWRKSRTTLPCVLGCVLSDDKPLAQSNPQGVLE